MSSDNACLVLIYRGNVNEGNVILQQCHPSLRWASLCKYAFPNWNCKLIAEYWCNKLCKVDFHVPNTDSGFQQGM